jgi:hypothetical protein
MHLMPIQFACSIKGSHISRSILILGCGALFPTDEALKEHYSKAHAEVAPPDVDGDFGGRVKEVLGAGKRKFVEDDVTPIIEAMPAEIARKNRPVYEGPSRSLSIAQGRSAKRPRKKE